MPDQNIDSVPARVSVPAWTTVEYFDKDGNLVGKFDAPRPYDKDCNVDGLGDNGPWTAKFTSVSPPAESTDSDFPVGA